MSGESSPLSSPPSPKDSAILSSPPSSVPTPPSLKPRRKGYASIATRTLPRAAKSVANAKINTRGRLRPRGAAIHGPWRSDYSVSDRIAALRAECLKRGIVKKARSKEGIVQILREHDERLNDTIRTTSPPALDTSKEDHMELDDLGAARSPRREGLERVSGEHQVRTPTPSLANSGSIPPEHATEQVPELAEVPGHEQPPGEGQNKDVARALENAYDDWGHAYVLEDQHFNNGSLEAKKAAEDKEQKARELENSRIAHSVEACKLREIESEYNGQPVHLLQYDEGGFGECLWRAFARSYYGDGNRYLDALIMAQNTYRVMTSDNRPRSQLSDDEKLLHDEREQMSDDIEHQLYRNAGTTSTRPWGRDDGGHESAWLLAQAFCVHVIVHCARWRKNAAGTAYLAETMWYSGSQWEAVPHGRNPSRVIHLVNYQDFHWTAAMPRTSSDKGNQGSSSTDKHGKD